MLRNCVFGSRKTLVLTSIKLDRLVYKVFNNSYWRNFFTLFWAILPLLQQFLVRRFEVQVWLRALRHWLAQTLLCSLLTTAYRGKNKRSRPFQVPQSCICLVIFARNYIVQCLLCGMELLNDFRDSILWSSSPLLSYVRSSFLRFVHLVILLPTCRWSDGC